MRRHQIEPAHARISVVRQCELLDLSRSSLYYEPCPEDPYNLELMALMDRQYLKTPFYGVLRMHAWLRSLSHGVNVKRVRRLMRTMGLEAIYPKRRLSIKDHDHKIYPYLLQGVTAERPDQVWATDITYIPLARGYAYLVAILDWFSRYVLSWELSPTLEVDFCLEALERAIKRTVPYIFNSDQGSQFTSKAFISRLEAVGAKISMDGRGRVFDNIFIERLWRSVKYEEVYLNGYDHLQAARDGLSRYFRFYNNERLHQSLGYRTPARVYRGM
jgi:putative transposase